MMFAHRASITKPIKRRVMAYLSAKDFAEKNKLNYKYIRNLCIQGKIKGARKKKIGGAWEIPENAEIFTKRKPARVLQG